MNSMNFSSTYQGSQPVFKRLALLLALSLAALFSTTIQVQAQNVTYTWQNANGSWTNNTTAWSPSAGPQLASSSNNTDTALFSNVGAGFNSVSLTSDRAVYGLVFSSTANAYTFDTASGKTLTVMSNGNTTTLNTATSSLTNSSNQTQTFNTQVLNSGTVAYWSNTAGGGLVFNGGVGITASSSSASRTLNFGGNGTIAVNSVISNGGTAPAGAITVTSTGLTTLSGNNTYDGLTTMNATGGTLTLSGNNADATGGVTLTAGTLNINHANALGTGNVTFSIGSFINNTSGAAITNAGNNAITLQDITFGTANSTAANNLNLGAGNVTISTSRTITFAGTDTTLSMGSATITSGSSSRILAANGVGNTLLLGGLSISQNATGNASVVLAGTANINIQGPIVSGLMPNNSVSITSTGTTTFAGNNTYAGGTTLSAGTLNINHTNALGTGAFTIAGGNISNTSGSSITLASNNLQNWNSNFSYNGTSDLNLGTGNVTMNNSRTVTVDAGNLIVGGAIGGGAFSLVKNGVGTLTLLSDASSYNGSVTINGGTLNVGSLNNKNLPGPLGISAGTSSKLVFNGGTLQYTGNTAADTDRGFRLTGNATFDASGNGASATMSFSSAGTPTVDAGNKTLTLTGSNTGNNFMSASISDNATDSITSFVKSGAGTWIMGGNNTYTGSTSVTAGKLLINGSTSSSSPVTVTGGTLGGTGTVGGSVSVGSAGTIAGGVNGVGTLALSNSLTLNSNSTFSAGISGSAPGTGYSQLLLAGAVTLNGVNNLALTLSYTPSNQQLFFLTAGATSITGSFDSLNGVSVALAQGASFTLGAQQFIIGYTGNSTAGTFQGGNDLVLQASSVPEPSTWALLGLGLLSALFLFRRQKTPAPR